MGEDQADVVAAAAEHGVEGITERAFQRASGEAAISFHVTDHWFDSTASSEISPQGCGYPATLARDEDVGSLHAMTAVAAIDEGGRLDLPTDLGCAGELRAFWFGRGLTLVLIGLVLTVV